MRRKLLTSLLAVLAALIIIVFPHRFSRNGGVSGQKRGAPRVTTPAGTPKGAIDYAKTPFSHNSRKEHQQQDNKCGTCHKAPTTNWQKVKRGPDVLPFPDVADFPEHAACVRCHRAQFFKGATPPICSGCHTRTVSPKNGETLDFIATRPSQFTIKFPHDQHQDVLAESPHIASEKTPTKFSNCEICHTTAKKKADAPPAEVLLKTSPDSHALCFNCHWSGQEPTKDNCEGCHVKGPALAANKRKSPQFTHVRDNHTKECTACHINITKSATLRGLKPDVPISACVGCHNDQSAKVRPLKIVKLEMTERAADPNKVCTYCHDAEVGKRQPPPAHYHAIGKEPPKPKDQK